MSNGKPATSRKGNHNDNELAAKALRQASKQVTISDGKVTASTLTDHSDKERLASALESGEKRIVDGNRLNEALAAIDLQKHHIADLEKKLEAADNLVEALSECWIAAPPLKKDRKHTGPVMDALAAYRALHDGGQA